MQSFICTVCGIVISCQSGRTRHRHSTHADLHPYSQILSTSEWLDYELADDIPQFDDDTLSQPHQTNLFNKVGAPIYNTVRVHSFEDNDWDSLAPFATPQQWQLCCSIVDTNLGKTKLNNNLKRRLIVPDANANNPDLLCQLIAHMAEMVGPVCGCEESSVNIEGIATPFWYQKSNGAV